MNLNNKTTMITESAVIAALMTIFVFLGLYLTPIILLLYPIPFIIIGVRHNIKASMATIIVSFILVSILIDPFTSAFISMLFGLLAIVLTFMINKEYDSYKTIVVGTLSSFLSIIVTIMVTGYISGIKVYYMLKNNLDSILNTQRNLLNEMSLPSEQINEMIDLISEAFDYTLLIFPVILIVLALFTTYMNYWLSLSILRRLNYKNIKVPDFSKFRLPNDIIPGIAVIGILSMIISYYELFYYDTIIINLIVLGIFLFFLQGLSVIVYLLNKTKISKILKGLIIVFLVFTGGLMTIIALIGLVDAIFNFRKIKRD
ncbi:YybS family protein [Clostridium sp. D2Q-14]|uniref:YybS family protein n=1 Tax=Anaeromonas gelatinilytica TaxID=2683194 RepID=UPI00193B0014|nr:YybS family protein [Anaeromonas gelatinilytica]MBS4534414.1 YybS family protein [Anaeromonas gelatinilytica]